MRITPQLADFPRKELRASGEQAFLLYVSMMSTRLIRILPIFRRYLRTCPRIARTQTRLLGTRSLDVLHVARPSLFELVRSARLIRIKRVLAGAWASRSLILEPPASKRARCIVPLQEMHSQESLCHESKLAFPGAVKSTGLKTLTTGTLHD